MHTIQHNAAYHCTRCGRDLEDAASREEGVGPVCRKLDNVLLAKRIPSDVACARDLWVGHVDLSNAAPETVSALQDVETAVWAADAAERLDWRKTVKQVEWALSFPGNRSLRQGLTQIVAKLGYVGIASLWDGTAATGKAAVEYDAAHARLRVFGPRNRAARNAFRQIPGNWFEPATDTVKAHWRFPAAQAAKVQLAVLTHYPNCEGLPFFDAALEAGDAPEIEEAPSIPETAVIQVEGKLRLAFPYDKTRTPAFVAALKTEIPWQDRKYNPGAQCWDVALSRKATVQALVLKHFSVTF
jgi:Family of unknown function (DUF6011)